MNKDQILLKLYEAKEAYYTTGNPIMTDTEFDKLEEELKVIDPDNVYFKVVGYNIKGSKKIRHDVPMLSCGKAKSPEDVLSWYQKVAVKNDLIVMPKIDGLSATIKYRNGKFEYMATRGDGKVGQDISQFAKYLNIPMTVNLITDVEVRGEIYLPKDNKLPNPENKPLRNIASGIINRKEDGIEDAKYLKFVAYACLYDEILFHSLTLELVESYGFDIVWYHKISEIVDVSVEHYNYVNFNRDKWNYETDGLVISYNDKSLYEEVDSK